MAPKLFIVAPGYRAMYESLTRALAGEENVEIIYDRRVIRRDDTRRRPTIWSHGPLADLGDRRMPSHVEDDLRARGWAVVRVGE